MLQFRKPKMLVLPEDKIIAEASKKFLLTFLFDETRLQMPA